MSTEFKLVHVARIFLFVIYLTGIIGISIPSLRGVYISLTPYTLLLSILILFAFHQNWTPRFIISILLIALAGFGVEVFGVQTGAIFGEYSYSSVLGVKVEEVPVMIALNWVILIYGSYFIAGKLFQASLPKLAITAALMLGMDLLMEPVAIAMNMWSWEVSAPPLQNYLAWFLISFLFAGLLHVMNVKLLNPVAGYLFFFLVMFFGVLNFTI